MHQETLPKEPLAEQPESQVMTDAERAQAEKEAEDESKAADLKQHADKLIQGFDFDENAVNRAVWELVQNACDLTDRCEVIIDYSQGFSFTHNGRPFKSVTLISLIKQVSNKGDGPEVGKFGTGFITTHTFGRRFIIDSLLDVKGRYIKVDGFEIDRTPMHWRDMVKNLQKQEEKVYELLKSGVVVQHTGEFKTTFTYVPEKTTQIENIQQSSSNLDDYIPIVLTLSDILNSVTVIDNAGVRKTYKRGPKIHKEDYYCTSILLNEEPLDVYSLIDEDEEIEIVLPLTTEWSAKPINPHAAKLFLFYPLVGTERWGCNFIIHSKEFCPTEPRDGIHLKSKTDQVQAEEKKNRELIEKASTMIFNFVSAYGERTENSINLCHASFTEQANTTLLLEYFNGLQKLWVDHFKICKLVDSPNGKLSPSATHFLQVDILANELYADNNYDIASLFWENLPAKATARQWTDIVTAWDDNTITLITVDDIAEQIADKGNLGEFETEKMLLFYEFLIKIERSDLFDDFDLLPNIHGDFVPRSTLVKPTNIFPSLVQIADVLVPSVSKRFIKPGFELNFDFSQYKRNDLSKEVNDMLIGLQKDALKNTPFVDSVRGALIQLCSVFSVTNSISTRRKILPYICKFYEVQFNEEIQANIDNDEFNYDYTPFRSLVRNFLIDVKRRSEADVSWVEKNKDYLKESLGILVEFADMKTVINEMPIYPNQEGTLCIHTELSKEMNFPAAQEENDKFKNIYEEIVEKIRCKLVHPEFAALLPNENVKKANELSSAIELELAKPMLYDKITEHPKKGIVLSIIQKITGSKEWESLFPDINNRKAVIMMAKIVDEDVKNDLFAIIGLEDKSKIATLGGLSQHPQMEKIVKLGLSALDEERNKKNDFDFKHTIGKHIENLVRQQLAIEVEKFSVDVKPEQGGQDMIAKLDGEPVYYVEVKSQWEINDLVTLSYAQSRRSVEEQENYALCAVDLVDYKRGAADRYTPEINDVIDRMNFVTDIGCDVEELIEAAIRADDYLEDIRLADDYRVRVYKNIIDAKGIPFTDFTDFLIKMLKDRHPHAFKNQ